MKIFTQHLWRLFLFSFPFSLGGLIYEKAAYHFGDFNPWVTGVIYAPEFLLVLTFLLWSIHYIEEKSEVKWGKAKWLLGLFVLFVFNAGVVTFWQGDGVLFGFFGLRLIEAGMIYILVRDELIPHSSTLQCLLFGALFQVILAFFQTRLNHSVGLYFLGEPHLSADTLNVAKNVVEGGEKLIRGYGTFLHPNVLGAYLMVLLFISLPYLKKFSLVFWVIVLVGGMFVADSQAAQLTTIFLFVILLMMFVLKEPRHKKCLAFGLFALVIIANGFVVGRSGSMLSEDLSIHQRLQQNVIGMEMVKAHPLGVGVGNFTLEMELFSEAKLAPWDFQVVHNAYVLVLTEMGVQGLLLLLGMIILMLANYFKEQTDYSLEAKNSVLPFLGLLIIASFDHLLLTSYMGFWLLALVLSQISVKV